MIFLSSNDIYELSKNKEKESGSGRFGKVYKIDDNTVYKIYHQRIYDDLGQRLDNPSLIYKKYKMKKLIEANKELKYTQTIKETIYIDGKFGGVSLPNFGEDTISKYINEDFKIIKNISEQLIRNNEELMKLNIYPFDYKPNNVMIQNNKIKIIDLDDVLTHITPIPNSLFKKRTEISINKTIIDLLRDEYMIHLSKEELKLVNRKRIKALYSTKKVLEILNEREKINNFIIINENSNLDKLKEFIKNKNYNVIYEVIGETTKEEIINKIYKLKQENIKIFDIINNLEEEYYFNRYNTINCLELNNRDIKIKTKKGNTINLNLLKYFPSRLNYTTKYKKMQEKSIKLSNNKK